MKYLLAIILVIAAGGYGYYTFSPSMILQHKTEAALQEFSSAVASNDRSKVSAALQKNITDTAKIRLAVTMLSIGNLDGAKAAIQDFSKAEFITFIDNILYTLHNYSYESQLKSFTLSADKKSAAVKFSSNENGDGTAYYSGTPIAMSYSGETRCAGQVVFVEKNPVLDQVSCIMNMGMVPKPEEAGKLSNPEILQQFLH